MSRFAQRTTLLSLSRIDFPGRDPESAATHTQSKVENPTQFAFPPSRPTNGDGDDVRRRRSIDATDARFDCGMSHSEITLSRICHHRFVPVFGLVGRIGRPCRTQTAQFQQVRPVRPGAQSQSRKSHPQQVSALPPPLSIDTS